MVVSHRFYTLLEMLQCLKAKNEESTRGCIAVESLKQRRYEEQQVHVMELNKAGRHI